MLAYLHFARLLSYIFVLLVLLVLKNSFLNGLNKLIFVRNKTIYFFNGPTKLVFVRIAESTFTGLVGAPYPYYSLVAFFIYILTNFYKVKL